MNATEALAERIAASLTRQDGRAWKREINDDHLIPRLACTDGAELVIIPAHKNRIEISPRYGEAYKYTERKHQGSITVSAERPAEQIAKEIKRRLLAGYRADLKTALERQAQDLADEQQRAALLADLAAAYGTPSSWQDSTFYNRSGGIPYSAEVYSSGQIHLSRVGTMSAATARKILAILADPQNK